MQTRGFRIGDNVKAVAFIDAFGKMVNETTDLVVKTITLHLQPRPYLRIFAERPESFVSVEGAERFFKLI